MNIRSLFIISIISLFSNLALNAQDEPRLGIGMNMVNNFIYYFGDYYKYDGGISIEPVAIYKLPNRFNLRTSFGYTKVSMEHDIRGYQKINYINEGAYLKVGITHNFRHNNLLLTSSHGINLVYSHFNERGNFTIEGAYFGNYRQNFSVKGQQAIFIEPNLDLYLLNTKYVGIFANVSLPICIGNWIKKDYPNYFIPGFGPSDASKPDYFPIILWTTIYIIVPLNY